jgi:diadenylate cyclase
VVRGGRIETAGIFLPMSVNPNIERTLGTRHRAALGISEETDALIIVVSEERGTVSLAHDGQLEIDVGNTHMRERLTDLLLKRRSEGSRPRRMVRALKRNRSGEDA